MKRKCQEKVRNLLIQTVGTEERKTIENGRIRGALCLKSKSSENFLSCDSEELLVSMCCDKGSVISRVVDASRSQPERTLFLNPGGLLPLLPRDHRPPHSVLLEEP